MKSPEDIPAPLSRQWCGTGSFYGMFAAAVSLLSVMVGAAWAAPYTAVEVVSDSATVEVSASGIDFFSAGTFTFDWFGNYWSDITSKGDLTGSIMADFGRPFTGSLSDFDGLTFEQTIAELDGTAGGTWIDLDASGLSEVGWVRFTGVASGMTLELDALAINSDLAGALTVPEPSSLMSIALGSLLLALCRRRT